MFDEKMNQIGLGTFKTMALAMAVGTAGALAGASHGAVIGQDNFSDGDRTVADNSGANGGGPGLVWYRLTNDNGDLTALSVVTDDGAPGIGGGNSLNVDPNSSSGNRPVVAPFASTTLGSTVGDKITASMDIRFINQVDDTTGSNLTFRVGLYNSNGTPIAAEGQRYDLESGAGNDFGYFARVPIGPSGNTGGMDARLSKETGVASGTSEDPLFGQDNSSGTGDDVEELGTTSSFAGAGLLADFESHTIVFSLERTAAGVLTSIQVDGAAAFTAEDTSSPFETFDQFAMTNMRLTTEWRIDNVVIENVAVPEPGSIALLGAGALLLTRRRNGRSSRA